MSHSKDAREETWPSSAMKNRRGQSTPNRRSREDRTPGRRSSPNSPTFLTNDEEKGVDEIGTAVDESVENRPQVEAPAENPFSAWNTDESDLPLLSARQSIKPQPLPIAADEFRAEFSSDHPLAGGRGKYEKERRRGKHRAIGTYGPGKRRASKKQAQDEESTENSMERLTYVISKQEKKKQELQRQLDSYRKQQNAQLLKVLEEERMAEENRNNLAKSAMDNDERSK